MSVDRQIAATAAGNAWIALIQIAFVPVYIELLGLEAYGLIGVYGILQMAIVVLDLGLTPTMSREAAHVMAGARTATSVRNLLRSLEAVLLVAGIAILAAGEWIAPSIVDHWLRIGSLEAPTAINALRLMAALIAVRLFMGVHRGVVVGSQEFVWFNATGAVFATLRGAGVIPLLWWHPTIEAFFAQQLAVTTVEAIVMRAKAWRLLPGAGRPSVSMAELRSVRRFAGGLTLMTAVSLVISQADKVVSSALLPLGEFGYYALASSVASALGLLLSPVGSVAYPRLNALLARKADALLAQSFHELAQWATLAVAPAAIVLAVFSYEVLYLWTGNAATSAVTAPLLAVLAIGTVLNCFLHLPCLLPIARGEPGRPAVLALGLALIFIPSLYFGVSAWGAIAAAYGWLALNAVALALALAIPQRGLAWNERWRWFVFDALLPTCGAAVGVLLARAIVEATSPGGRWAAVAAIALGAFAALLGAAITAQTGRRILRQLAKGLTGRQK